MTDSRGVAPLFRSLTCADSTKHNRKAAELAAECMMAALMLLAAGGGGFWIGCKDFSAVPKKHFTCLGSDTHKKD